MTIQLTDRERAVLAHVVHDPSAWLTHAAQALGEDRANQALKAKVERHAPSYDAAVAAEGVKYQTRAQREPAQ